MRPEGGGWNPEQVSAGSQGALSARSRILNFDLSSFDSLKSV